jgi:type VI secretion system secreted protein VgrG
VPEDSYTQDRRLLAFDSPLGKDVLLLQEFRGYEGISRLFSYELDLLAYENPDISFSSIVGQKVDIALQLPGGTQRHLNGYVSRFTQGETDDIPLTRYHAQVVPWLWFLTRQADCRIFQNMTAPDILSAVFNLFGFSDFRLSLNGTYPTLEYCVQYRETSFNFVSRIMEQFGIFYYFDHSRQGKHTLVLADQSSALSTCPGSPISYHIQVGGLDDPEVINDWHVGQEVRTGKYTVTDYNFTIPSTSLLANEPTVVKLPASSGLELFDYPGLYTTKDEGSTVAKLRMEEEEVPYMVVSGRGNARALMAGYLFELKNHYRTDQNTSYLVTEVQHFASAGQAYTAAGTSGGETYSNHFGCILSSVPYHPPRVTPKPFVQGPQPALAKKFGLIITDASLCSFTGTESAKRTKTARAGFAPLSPGPAKIGERCGFRASDRKYWSVFWKAIPTAPSLRAASTTPTRCRLTHCPNTRLEAHSCPAAPRGAARPITTNSDSKTSRAKSRSS